MSLKDQLQRHGFSFKKSLGQNFIQDPALLRRIVQGANVGPEDVVIEIGCGAGTLTEALAEEAKMVIGLEVDRRLEPLLLEKFASRPDVHLLFQDALKTNLDALAKDFNAESYKVVANLPYYITTPLMMHILENQKHCNLAVLMMQKEVADRITSEAGSKNYGAITVMVQYFADVEKLFQVGRGSFMPAPDVDSTVVSIKPRPFPVLAESPSALRKIVRAAFGQRRKKVRNALSSLKLSSDILDASLKACGVSPNVRGETLTISDYVCLANQMVKEGL